MPTSSTTRKAGQMKACLIGSRNVRTSPVAALLSRGVFALSYVMVTRPASATGGTGWRRM